MSRRLSAILGVLSALVFTVAHTLTYATAQAQADPRHLTVLVGAGRDTESLNAFFPQTIKIRAGDSITWSQNSDATHNVAFYGPFSGPGSNNIFMDPSAPVLPSNNVPIP